MRVALVGQPSEAGRKICISGTLAIEKDGSKILCGDNGHIYELAGDLCSSLKFGDQVHVVGTEIETRPCTHETLLAVNWISKTIPKHYPEASFL